MFCDLIEILLRIEFRTKGDIDCRDLRMRHWYRFKTSFWGIDMKTASSRASRLHSEGMNAEIKAKKSRFDERADFSARIASLPFIRNHGFARNDTKGAVFRAFPAFFKTFSRNAERENCKFEHRKCNSVLDLCFSRTNPRPWLTPFLWLQRCAFWGVKAKDWKWA